MASPSLRFCCLLLAISSLTWAEDSTTAEFTRLLNLKVRPSFNSAVSTYRDDILGGIAALTPAQINSTGEAIAKKLNCDVVALETAVKTCSNESDQVKDVMSGKLRTAVAEESKLKAEKVNLEREQEDNSKKLTSLQNSLNDANAKVAAAQAGLNSAEASLRDQERRYNNAKNNCIGRRRRRRGIFKKIRKAVKKVTKAIVKPVEKLTCRVFNRGGINNAKHARNLARDRLNHANGRVAVLKNEVAAVQRKLSALQSQFSSLNTRLAGKTAEIKKISAKRAALTEVSAKAKMLSSRVSQFGGQAAVLKDAVETLVVFDDIIGPLNYISEHLKKFSISVTGLSVDAATIQKITTNLRALQAKLPDFPFVENVQGCS